MNFDDRLWQEWWQECDDKARRMVRRTAWSFSIVCVVALLVLAWVL